MREPALGPRRRCPAGWRGCQRRAAAAGLAAGRWRPVGGGGPWEATADSPWWGGGGHCRRSGGSNSSWRSGWETTAGGPRRSRRLVAWLKVDSRLPAGGLDQTPVGCAHAAHSSHAVGHRSLGHPRRVGLAAWDWLVVMARVKENECVQDTVNKIRFVPPTNQPRRRQMKTMAGAKKRPFRGTLGGRLSAFRGST